MTDLVTLDQVNNALRLNLEGDLEEASADESDVSRFEDVQLKIVQATALVMGYLKDQANEYWTPETAPGEVGAAVILAVKSLYDDSAAAKMIADLDKGEGAIPALLRRLRDPALA